MAQTTAQRRAAWRASQATAGKDGNGERRLDMLVGTEADLALACLACRYSVTKREMLERLIVPADDTIVRRLDPGFGAVGQLFQHYPITRWRYRVTDDFS